VGGSGGIPRSVSNYILIHPVSSLVAIDTSTQPQARCGDEAVPAQPRGSRQPAGARAQCGQTRPRGPLPTGQHHAEGGHPGNAQAGARTLVRIAGKSDGIVWVRWGPSRRCSSAPTSTWARPDGRRCCRSGTTQVPGFVGCELWCLQVLPRRYECLRIIIRCTIVRVARVRSAIPAVVLEDQQFAF
jgi:hypothetical protein